MTDKAADKPPHVLTAINAVMVDIARDGIAKDRENIQQKYKFRGIDDVYNALAPLLAVHNLIIKPKCLTRDVTERTGRSYDGKPGATLIYVVVAMEFELISALDGSREVSGPFYGEAMDSGDKATNKAQSAAFKYFAMQQFVIPTEGDNDADATTHAVEPKRALWVTAACSAITCMDDISQVDPWWKANVMMIKDAPQNERDEVMNHLKIRKAALKPKPTAAEQIADDEIPY